MNEGAQKMRNGPCGFPRRSRALAGMEATSMAFEREASFMLENTPVRGDARQRQDRQVPDDRRGESTDNNVRALQFNCDTDLSRRWTIRLKL